MQLRVISEAASERGEFASVIAGTPQRADEGSGAFFGTQFGFIHGQCWSLVDLLGTEIKAAQAVSRLDGLNLVMQQLRQINRIIFVACGTSWHAALVGEHMMEEIAGHPPKSICVRIPVSQSDNRPAHAGFRHQSIWRDRGHPRRPARGGKQREPPSWVFATQWAPSIARETHGGGAPRRGAGKSGRFDQSLYLAAHGSLHCSRCCSAACEGFRTDEGITIAQALQEIPEQVKKILKQNCSHQGHCETVLETHNISSTGAACIFPVALEGALKLKEFPISMPKGIPLPK